MNNTAALGVLSGNLKRLLRAWISAISISSVSFLLSTQDSALFNRPGMAIHSCNSSKTRDSTLFKTSLDAIVFIVAIVARNFCLLALIFSILFPLLVISSPRYVYCFVSNMGFGPRFHSVG